jgi:hypothetical protein
MQGMGALWTGGISAGIAEGLGGPIQGTDWFSQMASEEKFFAGLASRAGIGAVTGGVTSEIVGGQFLHGFSQGTWTAAYAFMFNGVLHGALMTAGNDGGRPSFYDTIPVSDLDAATIDTVFNVLSLSVTVGAVIYCVGP